MTVYSTACKEAAAQDDREKQHKYPAYGYAGSGNRSLLHPLFSRTGTPDDFCVPAALLTRQRPGLLVPILQIAALVACPSTSRGR